MAQGAVTVVQAAAHTRVVFVLEGDVCLPQGDASADLFKAALTWQQQV